MIETYTKQKIDQLIASAQPDLGTKNITANGTYNASSDNLDGYSSVTVNVQGTQPQPSASGYNELYIHAPANVPVVITNYDGEKSWGDGMVDSTNSHTYATEGDYVIQLRASKTTFPQVFNNISSYILKEARLASGTTSIGDRAFSNCYSLTSVTIPSSVTSVASAFSHCRALTSVTIPSSITSVEGGTFSNCYSLTSVTIPSSVKTIGNYAFQSCSALSSVTIPSSVKTIGTSAFEECRALTSVTIPSSVTSIDNYAFRSDYNLGVIDLSSATAVPSLGNYAFDSVRSTAKILVPSALLTSFQSAQNWSNYSSMMVGV